MASAMARLFMLPLLFAVAAAQSSILTYERSEEEVRRLYEEWMAEHGRSYMNALDEQERRFEVFRDNLRYVDEHNAAADRGEYAFRLGMNRFADLTNEEYRARYLGARANGKMRRKRNPLGSDRYRFKVGDELPDPVDWREKGAVVGVKDQGSCGE